MSTGSYDTRDSVVNDLVCKVNEQLEHKIKVLLEETHLYQKVSVDVDQIQAGVAEFDTGPTHFISRHAPQPRSKHPMNSWPTGRTNRARKSVARSEEAS